ncbi:MAG: hypothetical protein KIT60_11915 [Burkholderiaceae bacterium]|jgi:hypothetical protein|nr:hypothetical protein [Burkholderiaceae bacterium]
MKTKTLSAAAIALLASAAAAAMANDFPTAQRVIYVQDCVKNNPGPHYEMINKCSCALDALAREVKYDEYVTMSTIVNAMSIGGERGNDLRDNETLKPQIKRYRELQSQAYKSCFITQR